MYLIMVMKQNRSVCHRWKTNSSQALLPKIARICSGGKNLWFPNLSISFLDSFYQQSPPWIRPVSGSYEWPSPVILRRTLLLKLRTEIISSGSNSVACKQQHTMRNSCKWAAFFFPKIYHLCFPWNALILYLDSDSDDIKSIQVDECHYLQKVGEGMRLRSCNWQYEQNKILNKPQDIIILIPRNILQDATKFCTNRSRMHSTPPFYAYRMPFFSKTEMFHLLYLKWHVSRSRCPFLSYPFLQGFCISCWWYSNIKTSFCFRRLQIHNKTLAEKNKITHVC